jgi:hypothetical protein
VVIVFSFIRLPELFGSAASPLGSKQHISIANSEMEDDMENAVDVTSILFNIMGGLGLFFSGVGVLWFVTVFKEKEGQ